jgi:hypothetical protein
MQTWNNKTVTGELKNYHVTLKDDDFLDAMRYCYNDILSVEKYAEFMELRVNIPGMIDRVIFNDPATIVYWKDGSKTVVKRAEDDIWDSEKGISMAIVKKVCGYTSFIKNYMEPDEAMSIITVEEACENLKNFGKKLKDIMGKGGKK